MLKTAYDNLHFKFQLSMPSVAMLDGKSYLCILVWPDSLVWSTRSKRNKKRFPHSVQNHNVFKSSWSILSSWYNKQTIWFKGWVNKSYSFYLNFYAELRFTLVVKYNIIFDFSENCTTKYCLCMVAKDKDRNRVYAKNMMLWASKDFQKIVIIKTI